MKTNGLSYGPVNEWFAAHNPPGASSQARHYVPTAEETCQGIEWERGCPYDCLSTWDAPSRLIRIRLK
jgi:hypothetical protein